MNAECMGKLWADKCRLQKRYFSFPFVATRSWQGGKKIRSHLRKGKRKISVKKWKVTFVVIMGPIKWAGGKDVKHNKTFYSPRSPVTDRYPSYHWLGSAPLSSHEKPKEKVIVRECLNKTDIGYWPLANCYFRFQNAQNSRQCPNTSKKYLKQDHLRMNVAPMSKQ